MRTTDGALLPSTMPIMGHVASTGCAGRPMVGACLTKVRNGDGPREKGPPPPSPGSSQPEGARAAAAAPRMAAEPGQSKIHDVENTAALNGFAVNA